MALKPYAGLPTAPLAIDERKTKAGSLLRGSGWWLVSPPIIILGIRVRP